jgi:LmbE family N-acetylglucosaminyl deacetylase
VAAHPDDENAGLIAYWANGALYDTAYLSLTSGDGGQNLVGVIRTQELRAARRIDRGKQFFTRVNDFGFSKSSAETLHIWDREKILGDSAWAIRKFRMITFTRIPYAQAARRARLQDGIVYGGLAFHLVIATVVMVRLIF